MRLLTFIYIYRVNFHSTQAPRYQLLHCVLPPLSTFPIICCMCVPLGYSAHLYVVLSIYYVSQ